MDDVAKVKQKVDIVEFIGEYIPLKKTGRNFKANCPFHQEKSPSFVVSADRQIWHCFGCAKGGDALSFLMEYDSIEFPEALKYLAQKVGVKLSGPVFRDAKEKRRDTIYTLNALAAQFYHYILTEHKFGQTALKYLKEERKLSDALIKTFQLGYAPNSPDALIKFLVKKKGYNIDDVFEAGLVSKKGRYYDFFKHRIIFPIADPRGNIIAFSGRALDDSLPKYVNTRETAVYIKGNTLYGLHLARDGIKKTGTAILVEGEFDVISSYGEGVTNVVAVKGTALTENQIKLLKRYAEKISFCFDTDPAGTEAQRRSISLIEKEGLLASVILPPEGKDPDELIRENPVAFKKAIKNDINVYDFIISSALASADQTKVEGKTKILSKTIPYLSAIENEVIKEHYFKKLAEALDTSFESIMRQAQKEKPTEKPLIQPVSKKQLPREEMVEKYLLSILIQGKNPSEAVDSVRKHLENVRLSDPALDKIYDHFVAFVAQEKEFRLDSFVSYLPKELMQAFDALYLAPVPEFSDDGHYLQELEKTAKQVRHLSVRSRLKEITKELKEGEKSLDEAKVAVLQDELARLTQLLT